jgi:hypothetical protein
MRHDSNQIGKNHAWRPAGAYSDTCGPPTIVHARHGPWICPNNDVPPHRQIPVQVGPALRHLSGKRSVVHRCHPSRFSGSKRQAFAHWDTATEIHVRLGPLFDLVP